MKTAKKPWYKETWFIIVAILVSPFLIAILPFLLLLSPWILLYLMWTKTNWNKPIKITISVIAWIFLLMLIVLLVVSAIFTDKISQLPSNSISWEAQLKTITKVFNFNNLYNKNLSEIIEILWKPQDSDSPSQSQINADVKIWDKTFKKEGYNLLVTYTISNSKVIDFFVSPEKTSREDWLLTKNDIKNLEEKLIFKNEQFQILPVQALKDKNYFTGIRLVPVIKGEAEVEKWLWVTRKYLIDSLKKPAIGFTFKEWVDVWGKENYTWQSWSTVVQLLWPKENLEEVWIIALLSDEYNKNMVALANIIGLANLIDTNSVNWVTDELAKVAKNPNKDYSNSKKIWKRTYEIWFTKSDYFNGFTLTIKT